MSKIRSRLDFLAAGRTKALAVYLLVNHVPFYYFKVMVDRFHLPPFQNVTVAVSMQAAIQYINRFQSPPIKYIVPAPQSRIIRIQGKIYLFIKITVLHEFYQPLVYSSGRPDYSTILSVRLSPLLRHCIGYSLICPAAFDTSFRPRCHPVNTIIPAQYYICRF